MIVAGYGWGLSYCQSHSSFAIAYFYFDFHEPAKWQYENLVHSLIEQFFTQCMSTPDSLENIYSLCQDGAQQPTMDALVATLQDIVQTFHHTYIIVDALDECSDREALLSFIEEIVKWKLDKFHILASSWKEWDIDDCLASRVSNGINIQSTLVDANIRIHVHDKLQNDCKLMKWSASAQAEIETALVECEHTLFFTQQWVLTRFWQTLRSVQPRFPACITLGATHLPAYQDIHYQVEHCSSSTSVRENHRHLTNLDQMV